jgi:SagB-type dehydrogenase family enzyme
MKLYYENVEINTKKIMRRIFFNLIIPRLLSRGFLIISHYFKGRCPQPIGNRDVDRGVNIKIHIRYCWNEIGLISSGLAPRIFNFRDFFIRTFLLLVLLSAVYADSYSQKADTTKADTIKLLPPDTTGGKPLMQALKERKTNRSIKEGTLTDQQLSNLLWAAFGVNRADGKRTAPSAMNDQECEIYVALKKGLYLYNAPKHMLIPLLSEDVRAKMGKQEFTASAAVMLVYVADFDKMGDSSDDDIKFYSTIDVGYISQNVYLYCASENLATVALGWIDKDSMATILKLKPGQKIVLSQCVGFPQN